MTDLRLKPFDFQAAVARAGLRPDGLPAGGAPGAQGVQGGFKAAMSNALQDVSRAQLEASRLQREVTLGNPSVSLEETMVAMQKAQIGFQATLQVRNRLVQAYSEIMNMQV
jgi:flagellar hook-basal body complex protein FliE